MVLLPVKTTYEPNFKTLKCFVYVVFIIYCLVDESTKKLFPNKPFSFQQEIVKIVIGLWKGIIFDFSITQQPKLELEKKIHRSFNEEHSNSVLINVYITFK